MLVTVIKAAVAAYVRAEVLVYLRSIVYTCRIREQCFYRAMHFSAFARSWDRMSSVCPSVCNVGDL